MMQALNKFEYEAFVSALLSEPYERRLFEIAERKLRFGKGIPPEGVFLGRNVPRTLREWRKDQQWSLAFVDRHQSACDAAQREFWRVMKS